MLFSPKTFDFVSQITDYWGLLIVQTTDGAQVVQKKDLKIALKMKVLLGDRDKHSTASWVSVQ